MTTALEALRAYQQADEDGVMVLVSRQACDEGADQIELLRAALGPLLDAYWPLVENEEHEDENCQRARAALASGRLDESTSGELARGTDSPRRSRRSKVAPFECEFCDREYAAGNDFHPPHDASPNCESGKHAHCSCDTCF